MNPELIHDALVAGLLVSLGYAYAHLRLRWSMKRKQKLRRQSLGMNTRRETEPYWSNWTPEIGRSAGRK
jgi:hypothetical protein